MAWMSPPYGNGNLSTAWRVGAAQEVQSPQGGFHARGVAAKDEFAGIKNVTRDDTLAGHRVPPQLMGVMPSNVGGFGDVEKAARVFVTNELEPLQAVFLGINDILGQEVVRFRPYELGASESSSPPIV